MAQTVITAKRKACGIKNEMRFFQTEKRNVQ